MTTSCPICDEDSTLELATLERVPILCNQLYDDHASARNAPQGEIRLCYCPACDHLYNASFQPDQVQYGSHYENSLHHSAYFRAFADDLARDLQHRYRLSRSVIVEVGCGRGEFLRQICDLTDSRGYGFDPSCDVPDSDPRVTIDRSYFSPDALPLSPDLLCCRHCLEHVDQPIEFLRSIRESIREPDRTHVYFEVPNGALPLQSDFIWDLIYEHPHYFTARSLVRAFENSGFRVEAWQESYRRQFLSVHGRAGQPARRHMTAFEWSGGQDPSFFRETLRRKVTEWRDRLHSMAANGARIMAWGAGSKGVAFLNQVDPAHTAIVGIVDVNPNKTGKYVPVAGHPVLAPQTLGSHRPDAIVIMNANYGNEIRQAVSSLGLSPTLLEA